jgi:hypothetical protein
MAPRTSPTAKETSAKPPKAKRRRGATPAQQAARARMLAELAKRGVVPSEEGVQAILKELEE